MTNSTQARVAYGLYPHQRQIANDLMHFLGTNAPFRCRVVAHLPTGAGKTRVAAHVASSLLNTSPLDDRGLIVWLANSTELCEQASEELERAWRYLGRWDAPVHRLWGNYETDVAWVSGGFLVAGLQKLWAVNRLDRRSLVRLSSISVGIIFDEAHLAVAPTYETMVESLLWENPPLLGLTATPGRGSVPGVDDARLSQIFDSNKVSIDPQGHPNAISMLIEGGYLAFPDFHHINFETDAPEVNPPHEGDYTPTELEVIGDDNKRLMQVINLIVHSLRRHNRIIVFCPSVNNAVAAGQELNKQGIDFGVITAHTPVNERSTIIERFRVKEHRSPMVLLNYGVLTAGFDAPITSCVIVARPTKSVVLYSQMVGRAMRGIRAGGNRYCDIYTVVDMNLPGFRSVADAFTNWEELWS